MRYSGTIQQKIVKTEQIRLLGVTTDTSRFRVKTTCCLSFYDLMLIFFVHPPPAEYSMWSLAAITGTSSQVAIDWLEGLVFLSWMISCNELNYTIRGYTVRTVTITCSVTQSPSFRAGIYLKLSFPCLITEIVWTFFNRVQYSGWGAFSGDYYDSDSAITFAYRGRHSPAGAQKPGHRSRDKAKSRLRSSTQIGRGPNPPQPWG
jgi:hypothetical protein